MPAWKAQQCSCHCWDPTELVDPHLGLLGWAGPGWRNLWPMRCPKYRRCPCTFLGAHMWLPAGNSPSEHTVQHPRHGLDIFTYISNPDTGPKHACYRLSYFPSSTDLSVYIFEQNCKSHLFSPEKHKKASVIIAHIC